MHGLAFEIRCKGTFAIRTILKGFVSIRTEGPGENTDVAEYTLMDSSDLSRRIKKMR